MTEKELREMNLFWSSYGDSKEIEDIVSLREMACTDIYNLIKEIQELKKDNRELNMEIGKYSQLILGIAEYNKVVTQQLEQLANKMLNGDSQTQD